MILHHDYSATHETGNEYCYSPIPSHHPVNVHGRVYAFVRS